MQKIVPKIICLLFFITTLINPFSTAAGTQAFDINAKSAILIDGASGNVLYEKNIHEPLPPASITKIMTMLLVMEALHSNRITLNENVSVSERASMMGGTQLYLEPGETKTVEELIKGIAIRSANDASVAVAEHLAGSEELFVLQMNAKAKKLGMKNTNFVNASGIPAEGHVTSAYDIALMSRELLKYPELKKWLTTWMDTVTVGKRESVQELVNTNRLIRTYKGATGIKTGYTSEALYCLSASATRGNTSFIAVIMAAPSSAVRFAEASKLLDYGFANFNNVEIVKKDVNLRTLPVEKGKASKIKCISPEDFSVLVKKGDEDKVKKEIILPEFVTAPIMKGEKVGEVIVTKDGQKIARLNIVSKESVERVSVFSMMRRMLQLLIGKK